MLNGGLERSEAERPGWAVSAEDLSAAHNHSQAGIRSAGRGRDGPQAWPRTSTSPRAPAQLTAGAHSAAPAGPDAEAAAGLRASEHQRRPVTQAPRTPSRGRPPAPGATLPSGPLPAEPPLFPRRPPGASAPEPDLYRPRNHSDNAPSAGRDARLPVTSLPPAAARRARAGRCGRRFGARRLEAAARRSGRPTCSPRPVKPLAGAAER